MNHSKRSVNQMWGSSIQVTAKTWCKYEEDILKWRQEATHEYRYKSTPWNI